MTVIELLIRRPELNGEWKRWALFQCDYCGKQVERRHSLGRIQRSCGCIRTKHGQHKTKLYGTWATLIYRCKDPTARYYGARGIQVCEAWRHWPTFRDWALSHGYQQGLYIDRKDPNANYTPRNCRWVTPRESHQTTRVRHDARGRFSGDLAV
jgi:hypothetical protein